ncbi:MAG: hypothetical protein D6B26_03370, partial [Spirochaetaceae bacterium]
DQFSSEDCDPSPAVQHCGLGEITVQQFRNNSWQALGQPRFSTPASWVSLVEYQGNPVVVYHDTEVNGRFSVMQYLDGAWQMIGDQGINEFTAFNVRAFAYDDLLYVAYTEDARGYRASVQVWDGQAWRYLGESAFTDSSANYLQFMRLSGREYVAFRDGSNGDRCSVMFFDGARWQYLGDHGFSESEVDFVGLTYLEDQPVVVFSDAKSLGKLTAMRWSGSKWQLLGQAGFSNGVANEIAVDSSGTEVYVAFREVLPDSPDAISVMSYEGAAGWDYVGKPHFSKSHVNHLDLLLGKDAVFVAYADVAKEHHMTVKRYRLD